jgi:hypothetical protein
MPPNPGESMTDTDCAEDFRVPNGLLLCGISFLLPVVPWPSNAMLGPRLAAFHIAGNFFLLGELIIQDRK